MDRSLVLGRPSRLRPATTIRGNTSSGASLPVLCAAVLGLAVTLSGQPRMIDAAESTMTVHVSKGGAFSVFGHNHEITAPIDHGTVDASAHKVDLFVKAGA